MIVASDEMIEAAAKAMWQLLADGVRANGFEPKATPDDFMRDAEAALTAALALLPSEAETRADETPLAHRHRGGHWLIFGSPLDPERPIIGCHCGFMADVDSDCGAGDSVLDHFERVARSDERAKTLRWATDELRRETRWQLELISRRKPILNSVDRLAMLIDIFEAAGSSSPGAQEQQG